MRQGVLTTLLALLAGEVVEERRRVTLTTVVLGLLLVLGLVMAPYTFGETSNHARLGAAVREMMRAV